MLTSQEECLACVVIHSFSAVKRRCPLVAQVSCGREINAEKEIRKCAVLFQVEA